MTSPWRELKGQVLLGSPGFIKKMAPHLNERAKVSEIPKRQRAAHRPALATLLKGATSKTMRDALIARAHVEHGYTQAEIGRALGLHYATVSRIVKASDG